MIVDQDVLVCLTCKNIHLVDDVRNRHTGSVNTATESAKIFSSSSRPKEMEMLVVQKSKGSQPRLRPKEPRLQGYMGHRGSGTEKRPSVVREQERLPGKEPLICRNGRYGRNASASLGLQLGVCSVKSRKANLTTSCRVSPRWDELEEGDIRIHPKVFRPLRGECGVGQLKCVAVIDTLRLWIGRGCSLQPTGHSF